MNLKLQPECLASAILMNFFRKFMCIFVIFVSLYKSPLAAEVVYVGSDRSGMNYIRISGELKTGDDIIFKNLANNVSPLTVLLDSNGGVLNVGLSIGNLVRSKGYHTRIENQKECASACGLIWLAGEERSLGKEAKVGFHAAFRRAKGRLIESGSANALVGAYLARLRLSDKAIYFATNTSPAHIRWMTNADAKVLGIVYTEGNYSGVPTKLKTVARDRSPALTTAMHPLPPARETSSITEKAAARPAGTSISSPEGSQEKRWRNVSLEGGNQVPGRAVLYEEVADKPPKAILGTVSWILQSEAGIAHPGSASRYRAQVKFPEMMTLDFTFSQEANGPLSGSILIEVKIDGPQDGRFVNEGGVLLLKDRESVRATPLAAIPVAVSPGHFIIGTSTNPKATITNFNLLDTKNWIDYPIKYSNGQRAIVTFERGEYGGRVIKEVFRQWKLHDALQIKDSFPYCPLNQTVFRHSDGRTFSVEAVGVALPSNVVLAGLVDSRRYYIQITSDGSASSFAAKEYNPNLRVEWRDGEYDDAAMPRVYTVKNGVLRGDWIAYKCQESGWTEQKGVR